MTTTNTTAAANPWMATGWFLAIGSLLGGLIATSVTADPADPSYNPVWAALGPALMTIGGVILAGLLVAAAITWHLRQS